MATLAEINDAANDPNLRARFEVAAAENPAINGGDPGARQKAWDNVVALVSKPLPTSAGGQNIADVLAYANNVYRDAVAQLPPVPGSNPAAVTDAMIREAAAAVLITLQPV